MSRANVPMAVLTRRYPGWEGLALRISSHVRNSLPHTSPLSRVKIFRATKWRSLGTSSVYRVNYSIIHDSTTSRQKGEER